MQVCTPVFADVTAKYEAITTGKEIPQQHAENYFFAPELMIQTGSCRIYVGGSAQKATLEMVMPGERYVLSENAEETGSDRHRYRREISYASQLPTHIQQLV